MRRLLLSAAILSLGLAAPVAAQQPSSTQPHQSGSQPEQSGSTQPRATQAQQGAEEQNVSKDEIRQIQEALNQKGFKAGPADGVLGPETKNALKEFQQKQGFNATGELDNQTMSALGVSTTGQAGQQPGATGQQRPNTGQTNSNSR